MTEEKWNTFTSFDRPFWSWIPNQGSNRDFFLIAVGWLRLYENDLSGIVYSNLLDLIEKYADGKIFATELESEARKALADIERRSLELQRQGMSTQSAREQQDADFAAIVAAMKAAGPSTLADPSKLNYKGSSTALSVLANLGTRKPEKIAILRDVLGNPFRPVTHDPSWLTATVLALANGVYQEKAFDRLPILADALQDAGCDNEEILQHCRGTGPHVRGCWVIDLLTDRE